MERTPKLVDTEDERRRRERRRREREARHRDGKDGKESKDGKPRSSKKSNYHMDIIDKLDVTSIYGTGSELEPIAIWQKHLLTGVVWYSVPSRRAVRCLQS